MPVLRGLFGAKKKSEGQAADSFRTVVTTPWTVEYSGTLPATPGIRHTLICVAIAPHIAEILLEQGFRPIAGKRPTHTIKCTAALAKDAYQPRALFDLYLDLAQIKSLDWQSWIAVQTCQGLRKRMLTCTERSLLIRCKTENEFPWCLDDVTLDFAWLDDGNRYLRSALAEYEAIKQV